MLRGYLPECETSHGIGDCLGLRRRLHAVVALMAPHAKRKERIAGIWVTRKTSKMWASKFNRKNTTRNQALKESLALDGNGCGLRIAYSCTCCPQTATRNLKCYKVIREYYVHGKMEGEAEDCEKGRTLVTDAAFGLI
ncbi:hypothetical protein RU639_003490 [Aspergillus parasiticus]